MKSIGRFIFTLLCLIPALAMAASLNINKADAKTIAKAMKGVGDSKAAAIVEYRDKHGPFKSVDELKQVEGIGQKTIDENRDVISVSSE